MNKAGIVFILGMLLGLAVSSAHADFESCEFSLDSGYKSAHPVECAFYDVSSFPVLGTMMTSSLGMAGKEAYIGQVREEAADYVGSEGKAVIGAELGEMIQEIRSQDEAKAKLNDLEVSKIILSDK